MALSSRSSVRAESQNAGISPRARASHVQLRSTPRYRWAPYPSVVKRRTWANDDAKAFSSATRVRWVQPIRQVPEQPSPQRNPRKRTRPADDEGDALYPSRPHPAPVTTTEMVSNGWFGPFNVVRNILPNLSVWSGLRVPFAKIAHLCQSTTGGMRRAFASTVQIAGTVAGTVKRRAFTSQYDSGLPHRRTTSPSGGYPIYRYSFRPEQLAGLGQHVREIMTTRLSRRHRRIRSLSPAQVPHESGQPPAFEFTFSLADILPSFMNRIYADLMDLSEDPEPARPDESEPMDGVEGPNSPSASQLQTTLVEHLARADPGSPATDAKTPVPDDANVVPMEGVERTAPITAPGVADLSPLPGSQEMDVENSGTRYSPPPTPTSRARPAEKIAAVSRPTKNHHQPQDNDNVDAERESRHGSNNDRSCNDVKSKYLGAQNRNFSNGESPITEPVANGMAEEDIRTTPRPTRNNAQEITPLPADAYPERFAALFGDNSPRNFGDHNDTPTPSMSLFRPNSSQPAGASGQSDRGSGELSANDSDRPEEHASTSPSHGDNTSSSLPQSQPSDLRRYYDSLTSRVDLSPTRAEPRNAQSRHTQRPSVSEESSRPPSRDSPSKAAPVKESAEHSARRAAIVPSLLPWLDSEPLPEPETVSQTDTMKSKAAPATTTDELAATTEQLSIAAPPEPEPSAPEDEREEHDEDLGVADHEGSPLHVHWLESMSPLGRPISSVRIFNPESPVSRRPAGRRLPLYHRDWRQIEHETRRRRLPQRRRLPPGEAVRPLSPEWEARVEEAMSAPPGRQLATTLHGDPLTRRDLATCHTLMAWLNDEVINAYLEHLVDYLRRSTGNAGRLDRPKYHAFNSFFFSNLREKGYNSVRRWANRAKIGGSALLDVDTVFIPVHQAAHWTLLVVRPASKTIEYFDSLGSPSPQTYINHAKAWLKGELQDLYVDEEWTVLDTPSPQQDNGSDCGVFLLSTAKAIGLGLEPSVYGPRDIPTLRKKIVAELLNGGLEGEFDPVGNTGESRL